MRKHWATIATLLCLAGGQGRAWANFIPLGDLPGGLFLSRASGVSADGSVVVGSSVSASSLEAFRWTPGEGMVGLGFLPGFPTSGASAASANGSVVVGTSLGPSEEEAFRWTAAGGLVGLGVLPGGEGGLSSALVVSADGSLVVGVSDSSAGRQAFRWTEAGA